MQQGAPVTISTQEFRVIGEKLHMPEFGGTEEALRVKVEGFYQRMLPFVEKMSDSKYDDVIPAPVIIVR